DGRGQPQVLELRRLVGNHPEGAADRSLLQVEVTAEAAHALDAEGEVELACLLELLLLLLGEEAVAEVLRVGGAERGMVERHELPVEPDQGGARGGQVQVRRPPLDHLAQEGLDRRHRVGQSRRRATWLPLTPRSGPTAGRHLCADARRPETLLEQLRTGCRARLRRARHVPSARSARAIAREPHASACGDGGPGASEARSPRSGRALDGPPGAQSAIVTRRLPPTVLKPSPTSPSPLPPPP